MINQKLKIKLISLASLAVLIGVFTQCVPTNTQQIGNSSSSNYNAPPTPTPPKDEGQVINQTQVETGIKSYEQILFTMSALTGVDAFNGSIQTVYRQVETTLPTDNDVKTFLPPHQLAITKLAAEYCHILVDSATLRDQIWTGYNFNALPAAGLSTQNRDFIIDKSIERFWGDVVSNEERGLAEDEFHQLIDDLLVSENTTTSTTTRNIIKAVCTSALSSAHVTLL